MEGQGCPAPISDDFSSHHLDNIPSMCLCKQGKWPGKVKAFGRIVSILVQIRFDLVLGVELLVPVSTVPILCDIDLFILFDLGMENPPVACTVVEKIY